MDLKHLLGQKAPQTQTEEIPSQKAAEQPWVAIATPTRGTVFTEMLEYVEQVRDSYPRIRHFFTHNLPIPASFNQLAEQILADKKYQYIWWIEDDTIPLDRTLDKFFEAMQQGFDIAAVDYGFNGGFNTIVRSQMTNDILFTGFGCTFMKRSVLEAFEKPIFKADKSFNISSMQWFPVDPNEAYGQYDIRFGSEARKKGFTFTQIDGECRHLQLIELGRKEKNAGCHVISEKDRISQHLTLPLRDL